LELIQTNNTSYEVHRVQAIPLEWRLFKNASSGNLIINPTRTLTPTPRKPNQEILNPITFRFAARNLDEKPIWIQYFTQALQNHRVFGIPLEVIIRRESVVFTVANNVPTIVVFLIDCITKNQGLTTPGLFRIPGRVAKRDILLKVLNRTPPKEGYLSLTSGDEYTLFEFADVLTEYLTSLPDPLFSTNLVNSWLSSCQIEDPEARNKEVQNLLNQLPKVSRQLIQYLFQNLLIPIHIESGKYEKKEMLDAKGLSTLFSPALILPRDKENDTPAQLMKLAELMSIGAMVLEHMILNFLLFRFE